MADPIPVFVGDVDVQAKFHPDAPAQLARWMNGLAGERVEVVVRKRRSQRSNQANAYYWGVVIALIADHCGYEPAEMHEALAMKFLRTEDCPITGAPRRRRTPKLNTKEFTDYVDACIRFAAELGVVVPEAGQVEAA